MDTVLDLLKLESAVGLEHQSLFVIVWERQCCIQSSSGIAQQDIKIYVFIDSVLRGYTVMPLLPRNKSYIFGSL